MYRRTFLSTALGVPTVVGLCVSNERIRGQSHQSQSYALLDVLEARTELVRGVPIYNRAPGHPHPSADLFTLTVDLLPGDLVYLEGQAEISWLATLVETGQLFALRIKNTATPDELASYWSSSNINSSMEHLPLQVSTVYRANNRSRVSFALNAHAGSDQPLDFGKELPIPSGYGHLLAEVYRPTTGAPMGTRFLVDIRESRQELTSELRVAPAGPGGGQFNKDIYTLTLAVQTGDVVYLEGQVEVTNDLGVPVGFAVEMKNDRTPEYISYSSSQWITPDVHHLPLHVSTIYNVTSNGSMSFAINAHAWADVDVGRTLRVESGYGHLLAKIYRPTRKSPQK